MSGMYELKKYSIYLLSYILLILLSVAGFNWFINPYDIYESPVIEGVNKYKSEVERHTRLSKVYQLEKLKPDAVLLASSRGLVVPDEMFTAEGMTGFNLSLTSGSTYELYRMLQHAQNVRPLKRVVQQSVQNPLAVELLRQELPEGCVVRVDSDSDNFMFERL